MKHLMPGFEATHDDLNKQPTVVKNVQKRFLDVPDNLESNIYRPLVSKYWVS